MAEYIAESFKTNRIGNHGVVHFANLEFMGEKNYWDKYNETKFNSAIELISRAILEDSHLKDDDVGKFAIAFPFGFVLYCFGTPGEDGEIDSTPVRYDEFEFCDDLTNFKRITQVKPCRLEHKILAHEGDLWGPSKTIKEYYEKDRQLFKIESPYPNKRFK